MPSLSPHRIQPAARRVVAVAATADHVLAPYGQRARLARADGDRGGPRRERKGGRAVQCDQRGLAVRTWFGFGFGLA